MVNIKWKFNIYFFIDRFTYINGTYIDTVSPSILINRVLLPVDFRPFADKGSDFIIWKTYLYAFLPQLVKDFTYTNPSVVQFSSDVHMYNTLCLLSIKFSPFHVKAVPLIFITFVNLKVIIWVIIISFVYTYYYFLESWDKSFWVNFETGHFGWNWAYQCYPAEVFKDIRTKQIPSIKNAFEVRAL